MALKKVRWHTEVKGLIFDKASFWIQVHDLPLGCLNIGVAQDIVSVARDVTVSEESNEEYEGSQFLQVRVPVDITKPLCRGRKIELNDGEDSWVSFKYERLPNLYYWCGRLTHHDKDCSLWSKRKGSMKEGGQQFGSWLRESTPNLGKKTIIRLEGYEYE